VDDENAFLFIFFNFFLRSQVSLSSHTQIGFAVTFSSSS
jgi:hypothetical protein